MKRTHATSRALLAACAVAVLTAPASAGLRTRTLPAVADGIDPQLVARAAQAPEGRVHAIVRVPRGERRAVEADGVRLLRSLRGELWLASLPAPVVTSGSLPSRVTSAWELRAADRQAPGLRERRSRLARGESVSLRVKTFRDASAAAVREIVLRHGGEILRELPKHGIVDVRVPASAFDELSTEDAVRWIERAPGEAADAMDGLRFDLEVDPVHAAGFLGSGVVFGQWETGRPDSTHPDHVGRTPSGEPGLTTTPHATHVAGILLGDGTNSQAQGGTPLQWRGVAPGASLVSWSLQNVIAELDTAISLHDIDIANNSWTYVVNGSNCEMYGAYASDAPELDAIVRGLYGKTIPIAFSAGNDRDDAECGIAGNGGYWTIPPPSTAKNVLTVGAHFSDVLTMTPFSSWGPTADGRMKPDVSAPGCEQFGEFGIRSTWFSGTYQVMCGTSMSAPAVSACVALLYEVWHAIYAGDPRPATAKALLGGFAKDRAGPGPDYRFGLGAVDADRSVHELRTGTTIEDEVDDLGLDSWTFTVPPGTDTLVVTLVWDDPPAAELADTTLVNDLDLELVDPALGTHLPFVLDPANPSADAVTGVNRLDNVEQVRVLSPAAGTWEARVLGTDVPDGPQLYSLVGFDKRSPADAAAATATAVDDTTITLTWIRAGDADRAGTLVVRSAGPIGWAPSEGESYVVGASPFPGVTVVAADDVDHSSVPLEDDELFPGLEYYYALFSYDEVPNYSPGVTDTAVTTTEAVGAPVLSGPTTTRLRLTGAHPARGEVRFRLELPATTFLDLAVHDVTGRRVATLAQGERTAGSHVLVWDGRRSAGGRAAAGVYFVRLQAGAVRCTQKVVLIR